MIDKTICKLAAFILVRLPHNMGLILLEKLELGVYLFCRREAELSHNQAIRPVLISQAKSEYCHAQILASLLGRKHKPIHELLANEETINYGKVGTSKIDGISTRYLCSRIFFWFQTASSYDASDKLAFMQVLEELQCNFYTAFHEICSADIRLAIAIILNDEEEHSGNLLELLKKREPIEWQSRLRKWQVRKTTALMFTPIDLVIRVISDSIYLIFWIFK